MPYLLTQLLLIITIFSTGWGYAATTGEPAFRKLEFYANYPWNEGFGIMLNRDEEQCRARYGKQWQVKCAASLGAPGETARGIKLTPPAKGHWQWLDPSSLVFIPENGASIKPDTLYKVDLENLSRPGSVIIDKTSAAMRTLPLGARLLSDNFWIDPSPRGAHRLAASFEFNFPVDKASFQADLISSDGTRFGSPEMVWSPNRDRLNISWPVSELGDQATRSSIVIRKAGRLSVKDGAVHYAPPDRGDSGARFTVGIPGRQNLFYIRKADIVSDLNDNLDRGYVLEIETSLYATPEDVYRNLLVLELPKFNSPEALEPYNWEQSPGISQEAMKKGRQLALEPLQTGKTPQSRFRFRIKPENGSYVLAAMAKSLKSASGEGLPRPWVQIIRARETSPCLGFMQPGNILPVGRTASIDIYSTDLDRIHWKAQRVLNPFLALVAAGSYDSFEQPLASSGLDMDSVSASMEGNMPVPPARPGEARFSSLDLLPVMAKIDSPDNNPNSASGLVLLTLTGFKGDESKASVSRLILATDLGILVKCSARGNVDCFVNNLGTGDPAAGANVSILGANGKPVATGKTDSMGHISFPSLSGLSRESKPVAVVAEQNGNLAWLPLENKSRELNFSGFPTGGTHTGFGGLNAYAFGERGIYRPGETLHFGTIVRNADFSLPGPDIPLHAEITDPRGMKVWEKNFKTGEYGISQLEWRAPNTAISGRYLLNLRVGRGGDVIGGASARIEEFQPDTLKLKIDIPPVKGWVVPAATGEASSIGLVLRNLYGAPAAGNKILASMETSAPLFRFAGYEDFIFTDPAPNSSQGARGELPPCLTDDNGEARVAIPSDLAGASSARITVFAEGFETSGGRATTASASFLASPRDKILGYRPLGAVTNMSFIPQNEKAELEFVALDNNLDRVEWKDVTFALSLRRYASSLVSDGNGGYRYDETPLNEPLKIWRQDLPARGVKISLQTDKPGEYLLVARAGGGIIAEVPYAVAGETLKAPGEPVAGSKMRLRLDKKTYNAGDKINLALSVPYDGSGLITLEREGVAAFSWFKANAGDSVRQIAIPPDFEGKGYVVVSFTRSGDSPAIYMNPHVYAVSPFSSNIAARDMNLKIDVPAQVDPGKPLIVKISSPIKGAAFLCAVDEGILQLTNHPTPQPLAALLSDRALDVRTVQGFDLLMPKHGNLAPRFSAFGGGMDSGQFGQRFENPFKRGNEPPVAAWFGPLEVGPQPLEVAIPIPDYYNGKVRLMAVGSSAACAGSAAASVAVAAPLILSPRLPVAVAPGDSFDGALVLANTTNKDTQVSLNMRPNPSLAITKPIIDRICVPAGGEVAVSFSLRALDTPSSANVEFEASGKEGVYRRSMSISVRPSTPSYTSLLAGTVAGNGFLDVERRVYDKNSKSVLTLSSLPLPLASGFGRYLDTYPHGCSEQLVSRSFGQLLLRAWPGLGQNPDARKTLLDATLAALRARYNGEGIALWPDSEPDLLLTIYAADFLLGLREAAIGGADDLLIQLCDSIQNNCQLNDSTVDAARISAYAIWVLTREGRITTQLIENLLDTLERRGIRGWQEDLTAVFLAASQKQMQMRNTIPFYEINYNAGGWWDEFAQQAMHVTLLARYFPEKCGGEVKDDFYQAARQAMIDKNYASFSACQGMRALIALAANSSPAMIQAKASCMAPEQEGDCVFLADGAILRCETDYCGRYAVRLGPDSPQLFWQISTSGYDSEPIQNAASEGIEVKREYLDASGAPLEKIKVGDEITVRITVRAMSPFIKDCVITDLLPGGFEMIIPRENGAEKLPENIRFVNRREDRMFVFADLTNEPLVFTYRARPTVAGRFTVPAITAEAMYNQACYGHDKTGYVIVGRE